MTLPAIDVVIPFRPAGDAWRIDALGHIARRWADLGCTVHIGCCDDNAEWVKANAVADALARSTAELIVVVDADVWCDGWEAAAYAVQSGWGWAVPHRRLYRLTQHATRDVLNGAELTNELELDEPAYQGHPGGGMVVLRRDVYDRCPLDPRFAGWGQEDDSWALALSTLAGRPWRGQAPMWHLWHVPQPRDSRRAGSAAGVALYRRYAQASGSRQRMARLVAEGAALVGRTLNA